MNAPRTPKVAPMWQEPGVVGVLLIGAFLMTFALTVDFPRKAVSLHSDESTYYVLGHSLAEDFDFEYRREDLVRVWREFPAGPEGIFLKEGKDVQLALTSELPFVRRIKHDDPQRNERLYIGKAFIYPLVAAPFLFFFGTNGFLVLHAILLTLCVGAGYAFLRTRTSSITALAFTMTFFFASVVPVYFVWLTPELFNFSLLMLGIFLWCYKEVASPLVPSRHLKDEWGRFLRADASTWLGVVLLGVATFSKPTNVFAIAPVVVLSLTRHQWRRTCVALALFTVVVGGLFTMNAVITGEFNYQGGYRTTFYATHRGFPFLTEERTFRNSGLQRATDSVPTEVLFNRGALTTVFPHNLVYFAIGRHTGLVPYFFPGVLCAVLFLWAGRQRREGFQWLVAATIVLGALALLLYMPFTYSGGGAPVGNRYFLPYYGLFLFVAPALFSARSALAAMMVGGLFCGQLVVDPFYTSYYPWAHPQRALFRWLPVELSLINDLPVNVLPSRAKLRLPGRPPLIAYLLDDQVDRLESGGWFWIRGEGTAEILLRAPVWRPSADGPRPARIGALSINLMSGAVPTTVRLDGGLERLAVNLAANEFKDVRLQMPRGFPYKPAPGQPLNYVYRLKLSSSTGFFPLFSMPGSRDPRFLGVRVRLTPQYR